MPRKRQRYKNLLRELKASGANPDPNSRSGNFLKFLTGQNKITQTNKIPVEARQLYAVGLIPFALSATADTPEERYLGTISAYSLKGLADRANLTEAKLGINEVVGGEQISQGYFPALIRAKFASNSAGVVENKVSGITKEEYRYDYGRTFSFPFGRTTNAVDAEDGSAETSVADVDELDVYRFALNDLGAAANENDRPSSVSYEPEVFKTDAKGTAYTATTTIPAISVS